MRSMTARVLVLLATICPLASTGSAQSRGPIIDVHMHAFDMSWVRFVASIDSSWWPRAIPHPTDSDSLRIQSIRALRNNGIVRAIASGTALQTVARYQAEDPQRIIPALMFGRDMNVDSLRAAYRRGAIQSLGEVIWQYEGLSPADTSLERFWALAEELDAPIGLHMGLGPPDWPRHGPYRISLSDPLQLEDVLARHPHLRLWVMHAGWPLLDRIVGLLYAYQHVYVDVSVINWYIPRPEFHAYLKRLVDAGFGNRIMYGSDQMIWPASVPIGIAAIADASFLTRQQKRDILCNNAARFFRLDPAICRDKGAA